MRGLLIIGLHQAQPLAEGQHRKTLSPTWRPDPQRDLRIRSPRTIWEIIRDYGGVIMGLYRGSNFWILPGVWVSLLSNWGYGAYNGGHCRYVRTYTKSIARPSKP